MPLSLLIAALRRRWYAGVLGAVMTAAMGVAVIAHTGVYWSQVDVVLMVPASAGSNALSDGDIGLIVTAGLVETIYNWDRPTFSKAEPEATLVGRGVRQGVAVRLFDNGGQWAHHFSRPVLDVQVVEGSPERVVEQRKKAVAELGAILEQLQDDLDIASENRIMIEPVAETAPVHYTSGDRKRAMAMTLLLGATFTFAVVAALDRIALTRSAARRGPLPIME